MSIKQTVANIIAYFLPKGKASCPTTTGDRFTRLGFAAQASWCDALAEGIAWCVEEQIAVVEGWKH